MNSIRTLSLLAAIASATGCASTAPSELLTARTAYARATQGPAAQLEPADLHSAKKALDEAEQKFEEEGESQATKDYAYTAERRVEIAEARARTTQAMRLKEQVLEQMHAAQANLAQRATAELGQAKQQLRSQSQQLQSTAQQLQNERQRREDAEKRAAQAAKDLAQIASVKQETRGMVITLSGSVLFASGKAELLPAAQAKLNEVATALTNQDPDAKIVIEGHTDSRGSADLNQRLSQQRAEAVRNYLVSRGIASERVTAMGLGSAQSIADNASAEGRANNRRVEIVVRPSGSMDPYASAK
jgi:outer membrane protein OmpA-like peptidoglycan-associated protein